MPSIIERKPSAANAREVIKAAERGEELWMEGEAGLVAPLDFVRKDAFVEMARAEEAAWEDLCRWLPGVDE